MVLKVRGLGLRGFGLQGTVFKVLVCNVEVSWFQRCRASGLRVEGLYIHVFRV